MKHVGKWIFILSTIFCSYVVIISMAEFNVRHPNRPVGDVPIGASLGIILWFILWCFTALPGLLIYWWNSKRENKPASTQNDIEQNSVEKQFFTRKQGQQV